MAEHAVELVVREARHRDAGRGIIRLAPGSRRRLGVLSGDTVVVEGEATTAATVWPADDADLGDEECRIDGELRTNAGVRVGDTVRVRPRSLAAAERVVVSGGDGADAATVSAAPASRWRAVSFPSVSTSGACVQCLTVATRPVPESRCVNRSTSVVFPDSEWPTIPRTCMHTSNRAT